MTQTNAFSVFVLLLRAFAVWIFCKAVVTAPAVLISMFKEDSVFGWSAIAGFGITILFAAIIWVYADKLAKLVMARPDQSVFESDIPASEWQALTFSAIGLWQTALGLIATFYYAMRWLAIRHEILDLNGAMDWPEGFWADWMTSVFQVLVGIALMLGARGLVGLIRRWRYAGA